MTTATPETARCWSGASIRCKDCNGPTKAGEDEYGGLAGGGDYERFVCVDLKCGTTTYVEMPD